MLLRKLVQKPCNLGVLTETIGKLSVSELAQHDETSGKTLTITYTANNPAKPDNPVRTLTIAMCS